MPPSRWEHKHITRLKHSAKRLRYHRREEDRILSPRLGRGIKHWYTRCIPKHRAGGSHTSVNASSGAIGRTGKVIVIEEDVEGGNRFGMCVGTAI